MNQKTKKYEDSLNESLKNPAEAAAYLTAHLEDSEDYAEEAFWLALRDVARAYGIKAVAEKSDIEEELFKTFSSSGNPEFKVNDFRKILDAMDLKIKVETKKKKAS